MTRADGARNSAASVEACSRRALNASWCAYRSTRDDGSAPCAHFVDVVAAGRRELWEPYCAFAEFAVACCFCGGGAAAAAAPTIGPTAVWVSLNGHVTVDGVRMENYWDRSKPLPKQGPLQLQTHGGEIRFRNLTVREISSHEADGLLASRDAGAYVSAFDGATWAGWQGATDNYEIADGVIRCKKGKGGKEAPEPGARNSGRARNFCAPLSQP